MKRVWIPLVFAAGCMGAHRDHGDRPDGGPTVDAPPSVTCGDLVCDQTPAPACADQDTLTTYAATCANNACSYPSTTVECGAAGCCGDHCCAPQVSNASEFGALQPTGLVVAPPNGMFDTDTNCLASSALGACSVVSRGSLGEACVCRMDELTIGELEVTGSRALVILAHKSVTIGTKLDVSGSGAANGPGASRAYAGGTSSNGGYGGSYGTLGGAGGGTGGTGVAATYGEASLIPLLGGMRGESRGSPGGGGGGALQITAGERISVPGAIDAGGGGGRVGFTGASDSGGSGGGSGGGVLLEAPTVSITGKVLANGAGGGGGGGRDGGGSPGGPGGDGVRAYGGTGGDGGGCPLYGYVTGGTGGAGSIDNLAAYGGGPGDSDSRCIGSTAYAGGGGGGGGGGRIRVNTSTGCQCGGSFSPSPSFGTIQAL